MKNIIIRIMSLQRKIVWETQLFTEYFDHLYVAAMKFIIFMIHKWIDSC